ncbi:MAG: hypothetical protein JSS00_11195 [Proteobacteria bacterium]|nr:hypothetical protein [Pseudomonadota bacterium]
MTQPLNATFFTLKHRDRAVLLPATIVLVAVAALIGAAFAAINWNALSQLPQWFTMSVADTKDPEHALRLVGGVFGLIGSAFLLMIPLYLAFAAYEAACLRWMIRGEAPGLFGWRLDHDMWRVYGIYWCWFAVHMAVGMAMSMLIVPIMFATMPGFFTSSSPPDMMTMMRWQLSVQLSLSFLQYVPLIFMGVRFGPAAATSIARQRFSFFEAWTVTRGRFWELLGSFALLWLIAGVLIALILALTAGPLLMHMWPLVADMWRKPSEASMHAYFNTIFSPQYLLLYGLGYLGYFVVLLGLALMSFGVNARAALAALEEGEIAVSPAS